MVHLERAIQNIQNNENIGVEVPEAVTVISAVERIRTMMEPYDEEPNERDMAMALMASELWGK